MCCTKMTQMVKRLNVKKLKVMKSQQDQEQVVQEEQE